MKKVIPYAVGICKASVCADKKLKPKEVEKIFNVMNPAGTRHGWKLSKDRHFSGGEPNPCPCDQHPETRKHYLFEC